MNLGAAVRAQPFTVAVGPVEVTVPAAMADVWLDAVSTNPTTSVVPGMCDAASRALIADALIEGTLSTEDLWDAAAAAIEQAAGRPWWEAVRLVGVAAANAQLLGMMTRDGVHAHVVTFGAWCAAAYVTALAHMDEKKQTQFEIDIAMPPSGDVDDLEGFDAVVW